MQLYVLINLTSKLSQRFVILNSIFPWDMYSFTVPGQGTYLLGIFAKQAWILR